MQTKQNVKVREKSFSLPKSDGSSNPTPQRFCFFFYCLVWRNGAPLANRDEKKDGTKEEIYENISTDQKKNGQHIFFFFSDF